jgi:PTH1 family peptidyl-tRNA hydrolase
MNNSGTAVADVLERYALPVERMLVVVDDFALPLGKLRLRAGGSDGGHNGLFSIALALQTIKYPRLRCGIAGPDMPPRKQMADFVLSPFSGNEEPIAEGMVSTAAGIALTFAREGLRAAAQQCSL